MADEDPPTPAAPEAPVEAPSSGSDHAQSAEPSPQLPLTSDGTSEEPSGEEEPEPSAFESLTVKDISELKDDELAGFNAWFDELPAERKSQFPAARKAAEGDANRAAEERRVNDRRAAEARLLSLEKEANDAQGAVEAILATAGGAFYDGVQRQVPEESLEKVPFDINKPELRAALDRYAEAKSPKLNTAEVREIVNHVQDVIESLGDPLNAEDLTRLLGESEASGKPPIYQYLMEIDKRARASERKAVNAEWEEKMPGERAAIATKIEKGLNIERVPVGAGARSNGSVPQTQREADKMHIDKVITSVQRRQLRNDPNIPD